MSPTRIRIVKRTPLKRVSVIGLGLMGGSLALALRRAGLAAHIVGCGRQVLVESAMEMGAIDSGCQDVCEAVAGSDYVFLCTPVETSITLMSQIAPHLGEGAVVTDVGSTKETFATAARQIFGAQAAARVLPGHPLAGRELSGLENASADLYDNCVWVLTPLSTRNAAELTAPQQALVAALQTIKARVMFSTPQEHDRILAYTSHLPQMLSTALSLTLAEAFAADDPALQIHAGGLRTMLRLAASEPKMWEQIAASNQLNIATALELMEAMLKSLRESLGQPEFRAKFEQAREFAKFVKS
ncbi:MAG: prephenate dehydrogenase/arogenate dehydrogenase family protein [Candidatus Korobacteraceae bacterium]